MALKRVSSLTGGKTFLGWTSVSKNAQGNLCSTVDGRAIESGIDDSGNVFVRFASNVSAVVQGVAAFTEPTTLTTVDTTTLEVSGAQICLIDGKLWMVLQRFDATDNRVISELWRDDTGLGTGWARVSKIWNAAGVGIKTSFASQDYATPIIKLSNGYLACGVRVYQSSGLPYWALFVALSSDNGATWSIPGNGATTSWASGDMGARSIWEIYPGIIVGNTNTDSNGRISMWSSNGTVHDGSAVMSYGGINNLSGLPMLTTDDGTIYLLNYWGFYRYKGEIPPTLASLTDYNNYTFAGGTSSSDLNKAVISDSAGKIAWTRGQDKYCGIFPGVATTRVRNVRSKEEEAFVRRRKARYEAAEDSWRRVII